MTRGLPVDVLERRAADQRRHLHNSVIELRQTVKQQLDVKRRVGEYVWPAAGAMALAGLLLGYAVVGIFTRD